MGLSYQSLNRTVEKIFKSLQGIQMLAYAVRNPATQYDFTTGETTQIYYDMQEELLPGTPRNQLSLNDADGNPLTGDALAAQLEKAKEYIEIFMLEHSFEHGMPDKVTVIMRPIIDLSQYATLMIQDIHRTNETYEYRIHDWKHHSNLIIEATLVKVDGGPTDSNIR